MAEVSLKRSWILLSMISRMLFCNYISLKFFNFFYWYLVFNYVIILLNKVGYLNLLGHLMIYYKQYNASIRTKPFFWSLDRTSEYQNNMKNGEEFGLNLKVFTII